MKNGMKIALAVILSGVFVFSGIKLFAVLREYKVAEDIYDEERAAVFHIVEYEEPTSTFDSTMATGVPGNPIETEQNVYFPDVYIDFDALLETNPEVVGWIWIPETNIGYPLMRGSDNQKYISRTYNGVYNNSGSIFMDYRSNAELTDMNSIIYGHNMRNGAMFGKLKDFAEQDYFDAHRYAYIFTPDRTYKYELFSAYVTTISGECYAFPANESELQSYIDHALLSSSVESAITPTESDRLILLSTCTSRVSYERFVVHGVLVGTKDVEHDG